VFKAQFMLSAKLWGEHRNSFRRFSSTRFKSL